MNMIGKEEVFAGELGGTVVAISASLAAAADQPGITCGRGAALVLPYRHGSMCSRQRGMADKYALESSCSENNAPVVSRTYDSTYTCLYGSPHRRLQLERDLELLSKIQTWIHSRYDCSVCFAL